MSNSVIASEARLVVKLDLDQAKKDVEAYAKTQPQGAPSSPSPGGTVPVPGAGGAPSTNTPGSGGGGGGGGSTNPAGTGGGGGGYTGRGGNSGLPFNPKQMIYSAGESAWGIAKSSYQGGLYGASVAAISTIPILGTGARVAESYREYGALGVGIMRGALEQLSPSAANAPGVKEAFEMARWAASGLNAIKARLDAITETLDAVKEAAVAQEQFGGVDSGQLLQFGVTYSKVAGWEARMASVKAQRQQELLGRALSGMTAQNMMMLYAGASGR